MHFSTPLLALGLIASTSASLVELRTCTSGNNARTGTASGQISMHVIYKTTPPNCKKEVTYEAKSGTRSALLGFRKFKGDNGFTADVDLFPKAGMHIQVGKDDKALGATTTSKDLTGDEKSKQCADLGIGTKGVDSPDVKATYQTWDNAPAIGPCRD